MILDTNALSAWAEGLSEIEPFLKSADRLVVPVIALGEYYFGIRQSNRRSHYEDWFRQFLPLIEIATVTQKTADIYADIRLELKQKSQSISSNGTWSAALAFQHKLPVLILSNDADFDAVANIRRVAF